jgi:hypothetical protein
MHSSRFGMNRIFRNHPTDTARIEGQGGASRFAAIGGFVHNPFCRWNETAPLILGILDHFRHFRHSSSIPYRHQI